MKKMPLIGLGLLALGLFAGCDGAAGAHTNGELGKVEFSYRASCFLGCDLSSAVVSGSTERVSLSGPGNAEGVSVRSTAPETASFSLERVCSCDKSSSDGADSYSATADTQCNAGFVLSCANYVDVASGQPGDAKLELLDRDGNLVDRATVHVREAKEIRFERVASGDASTNQISNITLGSGESVELRALAYDEGGRALLGTHGFLWQVKDASCASFDYFGDTLLDTAPDDARIAALAARASGTTTLTVHAGGASGELAIVVD